MYSEGRGVDQDNEQAVYWLTMAASQGHPLAQQSLGRLSIGWKPKK